MNQIALQPGPVTLYAQIASIMRDRIRSGIWASGDEIPTLEQMVEEFSVARITVRQAVQMLAEEGLLSSQRGRRTFVTYETQIDDAHPLFSSTGSIDVDAAHYSIRVLSKQEFEKLPPHLTTEGKSARGYMRICKIDSDNGVPYVVSDNYIALPTYRRIPAGAEQNVKLSRLVRDHSVAGLKHGSERVRVLSVSYEQAMHLQLPIGSPAAQVTRIFLDARGEIAYAGILIYRADRFEIERDITDLLGKGLRKNGSSETIPANAARKTPGRKPRLLKTTSHGKP